MSQQQTSGTEHVLAPSFSLKKTSFSSKKRSGTSPDNFSLFNTSFTYDAEDSQESGALHQPPALNKRKAPQWLAPFLSLRTQLTLAYTLLTVVIVIFAYAVFNHAEPPLTVAFLFAALIVFGGMISFTITSYFFQPLYQITDAAQAIAAGDLKQRNHLEPLRPAQSEVERLANSIHRMSWRLERAEAQLESSQEQFHQFFSDASHQLRTPLTSIRGFTELLLRGARNDPETSQHILTRMKNESERMTLLINDLLTVARLNDTHPLKLQYIDLAEMAMEGVAQAQKRATDGRKVALEIATAGHLGMQADKERVRQLIFILLDNALKYGKAAPDGKITLRLDKRQGKAELYVIDNGEGIAQEDLEHIFDAFYRGRHRSSSNAQIIGTGLGLTIASAIARSHNGSIHVCSEAGNTEFKVLLPCGE